YFNRRRAEIARDNALDDNALTEHTHMFCAYPPVAGHPTGGAVDVKLLDKAGQPLDFGTEISDFTKADLIPTFCEGLTRTQRENRGLLLDIMCQAGFAPFLGEWWHFSYGDREWSWWNRQKTALYQPLDFRPLQP
ncbi:MAG TPA: hypothetical protein DIS76_06675, partial [Rhodospirillaceae bacterium]|nr:hypothetical protein [Rhodospirillaceae bacterium]